LSALPSNYVVEWITDSFLTSPWSSA